MFFKLYNVKQKERHGIKNQGKLYFGNVVLLIDFGRHSLSIQVVSIDLICAQIFIFRTMDSKRLLCISTSFWVLRAPKSWSKHVPPQGVDQLLACRPALRSRQNHVFVNFRRFLLIPAVKSLKKVWNEQKRLRNRWKNV